MKTTVTFHISNLDGLKDLLVLIDRLKKDNPYTEFRIEVGEYSN